MPFDLQITMVDFASPLLSRLVDKFPREMKKALARTAGHFRKQLKREIGVKYGNRPRKKMLPKDIADEVKKRGHSSAYKHLHHGKFANPWLTNSTSHPLYGGRRKIPPLRDSVRYERATPDGMAYRVGFTGEKFDSAGNALAGSKSKSSMLFAKALQEGLFINPKTRRLSNSITEGMRSHWKKVGIGEVKKSSLDMKPRPVIKPFFQANKSRMTQYLRKQFTDNIKKTFEREKTKVRPKIRKIS